MDKEKPQKLLLKKVKFKTLGERPCDSCATANINLPSFCRLLSKSHRNLREVFHTFWTTLEFSVISTIPATCVTWFAAIQNATGCKWSHQTKKHLQLFDSPTLPNLVQRTSWRRLTSFRSTLHYSNPKSATSGLVDKKWCQLDFTKVIRENF